MELLNSYVAVHRADDIWRKKKTFLTKCLEFSFYDVYLNWNQTLALGRTVRHVTSSGCSHCATGTLTRFVASPKCGFALLCPRTCVRLGVSLHPAPVLGLCTLRGQPGCHRWPRIWRSPALALCAEAGAVP